MSHLHDLGCWVWGGRKDRGWGWGSSHELRLCCNHVGLGSHNVLQTAMRRQEWGCWLVDLLGKVSPGWSSSDDNQ